MQMTLKLCKEKKARKSFDRLQYLIVYSKLFFFS